MTELFLRVLNMSISASWLVLAVLILRACFRKAPKWIYVLLWGIVAVRLICPFSFESRLSLLPSAETVFLRGEANSALVVDSGVPVLNEMVNPILEDVYDHTETAETDMHRSEFPVASGLWVLGMDLMLLYTAISYLRLYRKVSTAVILKDNIYQSEYVVSPFVLGILRPRIYLPYGMDDQDLAYVVAHERAHIRRRDHWWKPLGFLLLTIHWFNPLMWMAYILLCRDIELACDEKVIRQLEAEQRADYTQALVACSISRRSIAACPLAFGEVGVEDRVRAVLNYKKPGFWLVLLAVIGCLGISVCFLTDPKGDEVYLRIVVPAGSQEPFVYSEEEISPLRDYILVSTKSMTSRQPMTLKPVEVKYEKTYKPFFAVHGWDHPYTSLKIEAEKGGWFKLGVDVQNPTDQDKVIYVKVKYVEVRISDKEEGLLKEEFAASESMEESRKESLAGEQLIEESLTEESLAEESVSQETMQHVIYVMNDTIQEINRGDLRQPVEMTREDAQILGQLVDGIDWKEGTSDCLSDCAINLGGHLIYYHSGCGTFNEPNLYLMSTYSSKEAANTGRCYFLTDAEQEMVEALLKKYISLGS